MERKHLQFFLRVGDGGFPSLAPSPLPIPRQSFGPYLSQQTPLLTPPVPSLDHECPGGRVANPSSCAPQNVAQTLLSSFFFFPVSECVVMGNTC